jgi:NitT/TauT family transport system substrate-binding protein
MKVRNLLSWVALFLVSLTIAVSCTPSPTSTSQIRMGFNAWPGWYPWQVAQEENIFDDNKVKVDLKWFGDSYLNSINALAAGQIDANTQTLNDTISSIANGADQVIVLVNDNSNGNDKIIVRKEINSIADLRGKKVAAEGGTVDHFLLLLGLQKAGLTQADIQFKSLSTGAATEAFIAGKVDAVGVFAPFTTTALKRPGSKELFSSRDFPGAIPDHLVVSRKLINEQPQAVQALVNSWFETLIFTQENRGKAYSIMAKRAGTTVDEYESYDQGTAIFSVAENLKAFTPSEDTASLVHTAQEVSQFLIESGLIQNTPNLNHLLDDRFVKAYAKSHASSA